MEKKVLEALLHPIKQISTQLTTVSPIESTSLLNDIQFPNKSNFPHTTKQAPEVSDVFNSAAFSLPQKVSHKTILKFKSSLEVELPDESLFWFKQKIPLGLPRGSLFGKLENQRVSKVKEQ